MAATKAFCARCGIAKAIHASASCGGYLEPVRKAPSLDAPTSHIDMSQLRSDLEEALTMAEAFVAQDAAIARAKEQLITGLNYRVSNPEYAGVYFRAALATLGNLGAS